MENSGTYATQIKQLIRQQTADLRMSDTDIRVVFDDDHGEYLILQVGWNGIARIETIVLHITITADKIWIEHDRLPPPGAALALIAMGIPKDDIVLGFLHPQERAYSDFAVA